MSGSRPKAVNSTLRELFRIYFGLDFVAVLGLTRHFLIILFFQVKVNFAYWIGSLDWETRLMSPNSPDSPRSVCEWPRPQREAKAPPLLVGASEFVG
jgi:hypothetical protein